MIYMSIPKGFFPGVSLCLIATFVLSGCFSMPNQSKPTVANSTTSNPTVSNAENPGLSPVRPPDSPNPASSSQQTNPVQQEEWVTYNGPVEHIFFHPLIAYPELAFDHDSMSKGYNDWFITVTEFQKILQSLYDNHFILVNVSSFLEQNTSDGKTTLVRKELKLPKGKKPLILSIDDINYYDYMQKNGNVYRLILDKDGSIATYSKNPKGETVISHENEIVPILDDFVKQHPDFSLQGAKGILSLTGYEGILGYRTNDPKSPTYEHEKQEVMKVVQKLKETGWTFACHGYGHLDANQISLTQLEQDTKRWKQEVEPLVGPTPIYIYPFGSRVPTGSPKFQFLLNAGFSILFSVGPTSYTQFTPDYFLMDRRHIDGISLHSQRSDLLDLFDSSKILDPVRPGEY
jgi:hypothetical protein